MIKYKRTTLLRLALALLCGGAISHAAPAKSFNLSVTALKNINGAAAVTVKLIPTAAAIAPPTHAKHIQLKSIDDAGEVRWTKNELDVALTVGSDGAAVTKEYPDMERQQRVQAHVQIQTPHTGKTEVLHGAAIVQLRPDLKVDSLNVRSTVALGSVLNVGAVVRELNGDVGASGKVYLKKGETILDEVSIEVLPFGNVGVVFSARLLEPGAHTLSISVPSPSPADYDMSNNSAEFLVEVASAVESVPYTMFYRHRTFEFLVDWTSPFGNGYRKQNGKDDSFSMEAWINATAFDFPVEDISISTIVDGQQGVSLSTGPLAHSTSVYVSGPYRSENSMAIQAVGANRWLGVWLQQEYVDGVALPRYGYAFYSQWAGDYVEYSANWDKYHNLIDDYRRTWAEGAFMNASSRIDARLVVKGADGGVFGGSAAIELYTYENGYPFRWQDGAYSESGYYKETIIEGFSLGTTIP